MIAHKIDGLGMDCRKRSAGEGGLHAGVCKESAKDKPEMRADIDFLDVSVRHGLNWCPKLHVVI